MTIRQSRPRDDNDPAEVAALARVNALRASRGLEPIIERDPMQVRRDLIDDRDAAMVAVAALRRDGSGAAVPDAIDAATDGFDPQVFDLLPTAVAVAVRDRLPAAHRPAIFDALDAVLDTFAASDGGRLLAELCVHRIAHTVRAALAASIAAEGSGTQLPGFTGPAPEPADLLTEAADFAAGIVCADLIDRLQTDLGTMAGLPAANAGGFDIGHESRCRRAAVLNALAQHRGDADMQQEAVRLALVECAARPDLRPSDVFRAGAPVLMLPVDATPSDVDAALCAELAAIADTDDGTGP